MKNTPPSAQTFVDVKPKKTYKVIISKVPSAQTEWKKETRKKIYFILFDMLKPINFCNTGSIKAKHTIDKIMSIISNVQASERTRLLSVESMKMEDNFIKKLIKHVGELENAVYGNTLTEMAEFERKDGRNNMREEIMKKFGYQYRYTGINEGQWELIKKERQSILSEMEKGSV